MLFFGFTGKNLESAYFLLKDSYGDRPPDKDEQQKLGRAIIDSFVKLKMNPPVGEGFHIFPVNGSVDACVWITNRKG